MKSFLSKLIPITLCCASGFLFNTPVNASLSEDYKNKTWQDKKQKCTLENAKYKSNSDFTFYYCLIRGVIWRSDKNFFVKDGKIGSLNRKESYSESSGQSTWYLLKEYKEENKELVMYSCEASKTDRYKCRNKISRDVIGVEIDFLAPGVDIELDHTYFNERDYKKAIIYYGKAIVRDPNNIDAFYFRSRSKWSAGDYKGAIIDLNRVIEINPKFHSVFFLRGMVKRENRDFKGAFEDFTIHLKTKETDFRGYYYRGTARKSLEDYQGAINDFSKAIDIYPDYGLAYGARGRVREILESYELAIEDYNKGIEIDPKISLYYLLLGNTYRKSGNYQEAIRNYTLKIKNTPKDANAFYWRGYTRIKLKDYKGAINDLSEALEINPKGKIKGYDDTFQENYNDAYFQRGLAYSFLNKFSDANEDFTNSIKNNSQKDYRTLTNRGIARYQIGYYKKSLRDLDEADKIFPNSTKILSVRALVKEKLNDTKGACDDFKKAASLGSEYAKKWLKSIDGEDCKKKLF